MDEISIDSFKGIAPRYGKNLPIGFAEIAQNCMLYHSRLAPLAKNTLVQADVNHYNSMAYHCDTWYRQDDAFYCPWKIGVLDLLLYKDTSNYLKKKVSWIITKTDISFKDEWKLTAEVDISFDADSHEIRSVAGDFVVAELPQGRKFTITGSTDNNETFTVSHVTTTTGVITVNEDLTDEAAGAAVTLTAPGCILSANGDFNPDSLIEGGTFVLSGSTSNNGTFTCSSVPTNQFCILPDEAITDEVAGDTVTIKVCKEDYLGQTRQDAPTTVVGSYTGDETGAWTEVAGQFQAALYINTIIEFNDEIFGATAEPYGLLLKWDGVDSWIQQASSASVLLRGLVEHNGKIYSTGAGKLFEWSEGDTVWTQVAPQLGAEIGTYELIEYNGKIYTGTYPNGKLYEWNESDAWVEKAPQLTSGYVRQLCIYDSKLYAGTHDTGELYEWNDVNAWVQKAPQLGTEIIRSLAVYNDKLYGSTYPLGKLYEWNGADAWVEVADQLNDEVDVRKLLVVNNKLYGSTADHAKLFKWNDSDAWEEVADQAGAETSIHCILEYNGYIYGTTYPHAKLYRYDPGETNYDIQYFVTLTRNIGGHIDESGPGTVTERDIVTEGVEYQNITVTKPTWKGLGDDTYVTHWNLYRLSNATGAWQLVASVEWDTTDYVDAVADADLGGTPSSYYTSNQGNEIIWNKPLKNLDGITTRPISGIIFGWKGSRLVWSEPGYPDAWVDFYNMNQPGEIKNCVPHEPGLAVLTTIGPLRIDGNNPETLQQSGICGPNPATSILGCCETQVMGGGVLYLSDSGVAFFDMSSSRIITDDGFGEKWFKDNISPTGAVMIEVDNIVYLFHSGGGLMVDFRSETPIATTLSEIIYGAYRKEDDDELYIMDATGIQKFGTAAGTKAMTWKSGELLGDHLEEKNFVETELLSDSAVSVVATNYVDGTSSSTATLAMSTVRDKRLGFLDTKAVGRAAQIQIYKAAHDTLTPPELEITEVIVRYTR